MVERTDQQQLDSTSTNSTGGPAAYKVGYKRPPLHTRFQKNRGGNPKGRKKKEPIEDMRHEVEDFFETPIRIREGGRIRTVSRIEAVIERQRTEAMKGDLKSAMALFKLAKDTGQFSQATVKGGPILTPPGSPEQQKLLEVYHATNDCWREGPSVDEACGVGLTLKSREA